MSLEKNNAIILKPSNLDD